MIILILFSYQNSDTIIDCTVDTAWIDLLVNTEESLFLFSFLANEKRAFLLYYCIPLLSGRVSDDSFMHLAFLVGGIYRLLKDSISEEDVLEASTFLKLYCVQAPRFYGGNKQVSNLCQFT